MKRNTVLYLDIAQKIRQRIFSGEYAVGDLLPTESDLERMFNVSKITVRKAIDLLVAEELVEKRSGKGTTVLSNRPYNKFSKTTSFTQILENDGARVEKRMLGMERVNTEKDEELALHFPNGAMCFHRLYLLDGKPYIYFSHYLPTDLADVTYAQLEDDSLYRILNQHGYDLDRLDDDFSAVEFNDREREALQTSERIGIRRVRISRDIEGRTVEYSVAIYDTNQRPYHIEYEA